MIDTQITYIFRDIVEAFQAKTAPTSTGTITAVAGRSRIETTGLADNDWSWCVVKLTSGAYTGLRFIVAAANDGVLTLAEPILSRIVIAPGTTFQISKGPLGSSIVFLVSAQATAPTQTAFVSFFVSEFAVTPRVIKRNNQHQGADNRSSYYELVAEVATPALAGSETLASAQEKIYDGPTLAHQVTAIIHAERLSNNITGVSFDADILVQYGMIPVEGKDTLMMGARITAGFTVNH